MVDTLVLGTSANAWEFESLHAQIAGYNIGYTPLFCVLSVTRIPFGSSADLRTDDAQSASPDSEQIEPAGAKPLRRNSVSVEQIQDESLHAHFKRQDKKIILSFILFSDL